MHTAICAFEDRARAEQAVDSLVRAGFARDDLHVEHKQAHGEDANNRWDGMEREIAMDPRRLTRLGHFFSSLFGRDHGTDFGDTYVQHVEQGRYVVVVDTRDAAEAERARTMLHDMQAGDLNVVQRAEQRPLRDIVGMRQEGGAGDAGLVERSREPSESWSGDPSLERDRAMASHVVSPTTGPDLRDPDGVSHPPGLRYGDKDKPIG